MRYNSDNAINTRIILLLCCASIRRIKRVIIQIILASKKKCNNMETIAVMNGFAKLKNDEEMVFIILYLHSNHALKQCQRWRVVFSFLPFGE